MNLNLIFKTISLKALVTFASGRMDNGGMIGGMEKVEGSRRTPWKPMHTGFVHDKATWHEQ